MPETSDSKMTVTLSSSADSSRSEPPKQAREEGVGLESPLLLLTPSGAPPPSHFKVHGLTALLLLDVARIAYDAAPSYPHTSSFGDEDVIVSLLARNEGTMGKKREHGEEFVGEREGTIGRKKREAGCRSVDEWLSDREGKGGHSQGNKL
jgi:hypothetical protein